MSTTQRPTPETDAAIIRADGAWTFELKEAMQRLERERDEAREQLEAMREAIRFTLANHNLDPEACIDKLQPFLP